MLHYSQLYVFKKNLQKLKQTIGFCSRRKDMLTLTQNVLGAPSISRSSLLVGHLPMTLMMAAAAAAAIILLNINVAAAQLYGTFGKFIGSISTVKIT